MTIILNDADQIIKPSLHDGLLIGINLAESNNLDLSFRLIDNAHITLRLHQVKALNIMGHIINTIVLDMTVSKIEILDDYLKKGIIHAYQILETEFSQELFEKLASQKQVLVCLFPSWGGEIYCICDKVTMV